MGSGLTKVLTAWNDVKYIDFIVIKENVWPKTERNIISQETKSSRKRRNGCVGALSQLLDCPLVDLAWADKLESLNAPHLVQRPINRWIPPALLYFCEVISETSKQLLVCLDMLLFAVSSMLSDGHNKLFETSFKENRHKH